MYEQLDWITPVILCATEQRKSLKIRVNIQTMKQRRGVVYMHLHTPFLLFLRWISVLVLDGVQLKLFLRDSIVPWFRFSIRMMLITQCCFTIKKITKVGKDFQVHWVQPLPFWLLLSSACTESWTLLVLTAPVRRLAVHKEMEGTQPGTQLAQWIFHTMWHHAQPIAGKLASAWEPIGHHLGSREKWYCASLVFYILII